MSTTIHKYPLPLRDTVDVITPAEPRWLSVGLDPKGALCAWAIVDTQRDYEVRVRFYIVGTGNTVPPEALLYSEFMGTVKSECGVFMWHVFRDVRTVPV